MAYAPVVPLSGLGGWRFLERTQARQQATFDKSPDIQREVQYYKDNIGKITSTKDFVADRRLLGVALGAFGLGAEVDKRAFVRNILDQGTEERTAYANRLGNQKYIDFTNEFSFGNTGGYVNTTTKTNKIIDKFLEIKFEEAIGKANPNMRLAMTFKREMTVLANKNLSENAGWYRAMGSEPVRKVLEAAFNLPAEFSQIDIDKQKDILIDKAKALFGGSSINLFLDPENMDKAIRRYQIIEQAKQGPSPSTPGYAAVQLLSGGLGSDGILNLLLSNS